jgi:beta-phosphoglucomutase-like phosphatase (HAD superfamily)
MARQLGEVKGVLLDGNDTLVRSVAGLDGGPRRLIPAPTAAEAVAAVRGAGLPVGVANARRRVGAQFRTALGQPWARDQVGESLGPFDTWQHCEHLPREWCDCPAPAPRLILRAAQAMGVPSHCVVVISDTGPDMMAAQAAGAVGILVPTARTLRAEIDQVPLVAPDLISAVRGVLGMDASWIPAR